MTTAEPFVKITPPRIKHNYAEMMKFLASKGIKSEFPPVEQQVESVVLKGLYSGGYNPTITRWNGKLVCAYRFHKDSTAQTKLAIADLDDNFNVVHNQELEINDDNGHEDCRFYTFKGQLWLSYVSSHWPSLMIAKMRCVPLSKPDHWRAGNPVVIAYEKELDVEKNHLFFEAQGKLFCIYGSHFGVQTTFEIEGDKIVKIHETKAPRWPFGDVRGGTTPLPYKGKLIRFFHSSMRNECPPITWRYYCSCMLMESEPPFACVAILKRPIARGSEIGGDESLHHFKKNVIFPAGAVQDGDDFLVSLGINDTQSVIARIKPEQLNF